jgi:hypothetical protein
LRGYNRITLYKRESGGKRIKVLDARAGDHWYHDTEEWRKFQRRIDKENDLFHETFMDHEGVDLLAETYEPLSQHRGRGDAKRRGKSERLPNG